MFQTTLEKAIGAIIVIVVLGALALPVFSARMEANTYNRITGADVTWWEALWVELRLDCN